MTNNNGGEINPLKIVIKKFEIPSHAIKEGTAND